MTDLTATLKTIEKSWGDSIFAQVSKQPEPVSVVPTGILSMDRALSVGGIPRGRITTMFGPPDGGKTTLMLSIIGHTLQSGLSAAYFDTEQGGSEDYLFTCLESMGVTDVHRAVEEHQLVIVRPAPDQGGKAVMDVLQALVKANCMDLIAIDSISEISPPGELDTEPGSYPIGLYARFLTAEFKKTNSYLGGGNTALLLSSQIRAKITTFGPTETTTEPNRLRHLAAIRVRVTKDGGAKKLKGVKVGQAIKLTIHKNKVGVPWREAKMDIMWGAGIDRYWDTLRCAHNIGVLDRRGGSYFLREQTLGRRDTAIAFLRDNPETMQEIREEVLNA